MKPDDHTNNASAPPNLEAARQPGNLRNILVAVDFSGFSKRGLDYALVLAEKFDARITLIHVVEPAVVPETLLVTTGLEVDMRIVQERQEMLEALRRDKINPAIPSEALVKTGEPWEQIIEEAEFLRSELVIVSSHGHSALEDIAPGNTTERVVHHARCPVLTVPPPLHDDTPSAPAIRFKKLLVPVDFSAASKVALAYAARLAKLFGAEIVLEHVIETDLLHAPDDKIPQEAEGMLARLGQQEIPSEIPRQSVVRVGRPFKAITEAARTLPADLIIITSRRRTSWKQALPGSTTERVVRHAPCAVWTVRG